MGRSRFAEIEKRVSGGGSVTSRRERKGSFIARHRLGWGSLQIQYLGSLALGITLRHRVLQATSAPALPEARSFGTVAPCPSRTQEASPERPLLPGAQLPGCSWGSTEVFRGLPPCGGPGGGEFLSHIPVGRLRALGSSRAGPGPLFSLTPSVILSSVWPRNYRDNVFSEAPQTMESSELSWTLCLGGGAGTR